MYDHGISREGKRSKLSNERRKETDRIRDSLKASLCFKARFLRAREFLKDLSALFLLFFFKIRKKRKNGKRRQFGFLNFKDAQLSSLFKCKRFLCSKHRRWEIFFTRARQSSNRRRRICLLRLWTVASFAKLLLLPKMGVIVIAAAFKREMGNENNRDTYVTATDECE